MISQTTLSTSTIDNNNKTTIDNKITNINNNINNNEKIMYLLRGISGSGKSTLAQNILNENLNNEKLNNNEDYILSTDDYFINKETNKYIFNPTKLGDAHQWNQNRCKKAMERNQQIIIIDNTNTQKVIFYLILFNFI